MTAIAGMRGIDVCVVLRPGILIPVLIRAIGLPLLCFGIPLVVADDVVFLGVARLVGVSLRSM